MAYTIIVFEQNSRKKMGETKITITSIKLMK